MTFETDAGTPCRARRKKVLWLIKGLGVGGAERLLVSSIPYLDRSAFDYQVGYFLTGAGDLAPEFEKAGIPLHCFNINSACDLGGFIRLAQFLRQQDIDVLHIHSPHAGILGRVAARFSGVGKVVYTEHSLPASQNLLSQLGNLITYPLNDTTIGVSEAVLRAVLARQIIKHGTYVAIHNGIDLNAFALVGANREQVRRTLGIPTDHLVVGNVGNLLRRKGHEYLLEAARIVLNHNRNVTFVIVGRANKEKDLMRLRELARRLAVQDRVIFTGFRSDVCQLMAAFDVFVLPSLWEGFGIVLLEAMAAGRPVVGTNVGGIPEVIADGENGFLVEPRNPRDIAEKVLELLGSETLRTKMGRKGLEVVREKFSIERTVRETEGMYNLALAGNRGAERARDVQTSARNTL
ncbi:MAG: glycosyltransferase [Chloroflexi bacterium]|nr:glycosyltransferase [Chloroflexota bacterium]